MKKILLGGALLAVAFAAAATVVHVSGKGVTRNFSIGKAETGSIQIGSRAVAAKGVKAAAPLRASAAALPWNVDFATNDFTGFTIVDANNDGIGWSYDSNKGEAVAKYSSKDNMDDWLITPGLDLVGGRAYTLRFTAACNSQTYPERIEVKFGDAPSAAAMTSTALEPTVVEDMDFKEFSCVIVPRTSGAVHIGFHGISDPDCYLLRIKTISLTEGAEGETPSGVKDFTVTSADPYALSATISFYAPETTLSGKPLASIDRIVVKRDDNVIKTFDNPAPGAALKYDDEVSGGGEFTYSAVASNAAGEGYTISCKHSVGGVTPLAPDNVVLKEIEPVGTLYLSWDPVTVDVDGNTIPEGFVRYIVVDPSMEVLADNLTDTNVTFRLNEAKQTFVEMIVAAYTVGGMSEGTFSNSVAAGPAFTDWKESFANGSIETIMGVGYEYGYVDFVGWDLADDNTFAASELISAVKASDGDNGFAFMHCEYRDTGSSLFSGKVKVPAEGPAVFFNIFNQSQKAYPDNNTFDLMVSEDGVDWKTLETHSVYELCGDTQGWHPVTIGLHDYAGKTVQIRWQVEVKSFADFLIDAISVGTLPDHDLKAEVFTVPAKAAAGDEINLEVRVLNIGAKPAGKFAVNLYVNGELASETPVESLAAGKRVNVQIPYTISPVCEGELKFRAEVVYADDSDTANNTTKEFSLTPDHARHPYVSDLDGSVDEQGVVSLSWSQPYIATYTPAELEDFEQGEDFAHSFGDWIFVDRDDQPVGNLNPSLIPGLTPGETKASFFVMNDSEPSFTSNLAAYSGHKYIAAIFPYMPGEYSDDWAITPALNGAAQIISFRARSLESYYAETMEFYYSLGSTDPADFIFISSVDKVPGEWTEYNIPVPTGTKRFAVRSHSNNSMLLMLDDFYFADANAPVGVEIEKYNVYCDGVKVGSVAPDVTTFSHSPAVGEHTYAVTTLYKEIGESKSSNKKTLTVNYSAGLASPGAEAIVVTAREGEIVISGLNGERYTVVTVGGSTVAAGSGTGEVKMAVAPGLYIVKAGEKVVKTIVR